MSTPDTAAIVAMLLSNPDALASLLGGAGKAFPRWHQPDPNVGSVLVHSQADLDALNAAGWPPKPPVEEEVEAEVETPVVHKKKPKA